MLAILGSSGAEEPAADEEDEDWRLGSCPWLAARATLHVSASAAIAASADIHRIRSTVLIVRVMSGQPPCRKVIYQCLLIWQLGRLAFLARPLALRPRLTTGLP